MTTNTNTTEKKEWLPVEEGEYLVRMNRAGEKIAKSSGNPMFAVSYQIISKVGDTGDGKGIKDKLIFENFHIESSEKAMEVSRNRASNYLKAIGRDGDFSGDFTELLNTLETPFLAKVVIKEGNNGYPASNAIATFSRR